MYVRKYTRLRLVHYRYEHMQNPGGLWFKTIKSHYNTVGYNTCFDIALFKDEFQKCIDYLEKISFNGNFSMLSINANVFICLKITRLVN